MTTNRIFSRLPQTPRRASFSTCGFMACPVVLQQGLAADQQAWQHELYQRAMEEAAAVVRPAIMERWQADILN
jgi:hypothetical protein